MAESSRNTIDAQEVAIRLRRGESGALETVRLRVRRILSFRALRVPADILEDLEQEVMTEIWRAVNRKGFDAGGGFWGFVETVTSRRFIDFLRARRADAELPAIIEDKGPGPLSQTLANERANLAYQAMGRLDAPCRQLIYLQAGLGKGYAEIGRILGKSEGALRVQMYRCVRAARAILDQLVTTKPAAGLPREERA